MTYAHMQFRSALLYIFTSSHHNKSQLEAHNAAHQFNLQVVKQYKVFLNHLTLSTVWTMSQKK